MEKKEYMPLLFTEDDMLAMRWLKDAFAPKGLLNPLKVFPTGVSAQAAPKHAVVARLGADAWV
jgi:glycolate oxidase